MTRDEAKQTVADDHGFTNWHHMIEYLQMSGERTLLKIYIDEAMDNYVNEKVYNLEQKLSACEIVLGDTQNEVQDLKTGLQAKRLIYMFTQWLQNENFTNPDMSVSDWVNKYFNEIQSGKMAE